MFDANKPRQRMAKKSTVIAAAIKKARIEAGMTQKSLAEYTEIGLKVIRTLEQGGNHVSLEKLDVLFDFLGLDMLVLPRDDAALYRAAN